jgi:hypothetical protein
VGKFICKSPLRNDPVDYFRMPAENGGEFALAKPFGEQEWDGLKT